MVLQNLVSFQDFRENYFTIYRVHLNEEATTLSKHLFTYLKRLL